MAGFLLGLLLLAAILGTAWWFSQQKTPQAARMVRIVLGAGALLAGLAMVLRGAAPLGIPVGVFGLGLLGIGAGQKNSSSGSGPQDGATRPAQSGAMTVREAREVLGVGPEAGAEEIRLAHRRLMKKLHPDTGEGSTALARQVQEARDLLLRELGE